MLFQICFVLQVMAEKRAWSLVAEFDDLTRGRAVLSAGIENGKFIQHSTGKYVLPILT